MPSEQDEEKEKPKLKLLKIVYTTYKEDEKSDEVNKALWIIQFLTLTSERV